jgi:hypothetical protein
LNLTRLLGTSCGGSKPPVGFQGRVDGGSSVEPRENQMRSAAIRLGVLHPSPTPRRSSRQSSSPLDQNFLSQDSGMITAVLSYALPALTHALRIASLGRFAWSSAARLWRFQHAILRLILRPRWILHVFFSSFSARHPLGILWTAREPS